MRPADLGPPTRLLLARHCSTAWTAAGRLCGGDGDGPQLSAAGEAEAARLADSVAAMAVRPLAVLCSPALRARQTAARTGLPVQVDDGWAELRMGEWHGRSYGEIARGWPAAFATWQASTSTAPPGGESVDGLTDRVLAARDRAVLEHAGRPVLVVSHAGPIRVLLRHALDAGPVALRRLRLDPGRVTVLDHWSDGGVEVAGVNLAERIVDRER